MQNVTYFHKCLEGKKEMWFEWMRGSHAVLLEEDFKKSLEKSQAKKLKRSRKKDDAVNLLRGWCAHVLGGDQDNSSVSLILQENSDLIFHGNVTRLWTSFTWKLWPDRYGIFGADIREQKNSDIWYIDWYYECALVTMHRNQKTLLIPEGKLRDDTAALIHRELSLFDLI